MTPQPWFRSNDKKIMMRIRQMENKAGIKKNIISTLCNEEILKATEL